MEKYDVSIHWDFSHRLVYTEIYKRVGKKTRAVSGEAHDIKLFTDTCSPEFNLESELCKSSFYLLTCELKKNSIICWQVRREIKEYMLHKKETYNLVKSKHVTYISMCMNTAIKWII